MSDRDSPESTERPEAESLSGLVHSWRWLFWVLGLGLVVLGFYAEENWRGRRAWENYRRGMVARGEPTEWSALVPPPVGEPENFAATPFLAPIFDFKPGTQQPRDSEALARVQGFAARYNAAAKAVKSPKTIRTNSWTGAPTDLLAWYAAFLDATNRAGSRGKLVLPTNLTPRDAASGVLAALSECDPVLDELRVSSQRPYSRFNIHYDEENPASILLPHLGPLKHLSQILRLRADAELALDRPTEAFNDVTLMLYLADACRNEPVLISQLVRFAQFQLAMQPIAEGLAGHEWSDAQLRQFQERLRGFDFLADGRRAVQSESVLFGVGLIDYVRRFPVRPGGLVLPDERDDGSSDLMAVLLRLAPRGWFDFEKANLCGVSAEHLLPAFDLAGRQISPSVSRQGEEELTADLAHSRLSLLLHHAFFSSLTLPNLTRVGFRAAYTQTAADLAALACALERYRLAHGQFPSQLEALVPQFVDRLPTDVINGQPLKYRLAGNGGFLLYSVGWNETDDGGVMGLTSHEGNVDPKTGDWIWR